MRRVLVGLLGLGMAVLSFDALRAYALTGRPLVDGVIPAETIAPRPWLAMLWAVVVDLAVLAGILGVKDDRHDWRAWLMLLLALGATLGFQVFALSPFAARAVPPVGLALAILVLDLGPARTKPATDLDELEEQQAELEAAVEAERIRLEEQWEKARPRHQVRRARKRAVELDAPVNDFTIEDWLALLEEFEDRCAYCDADEFALHIEHRTPLSRGGEHTKANIVPACEPCNLNKADKTEEEWVAHRATQTEADLRAQAAQRMRHRERPPNRRAAQRTGPRTMLTEAQRADVARRVAQGESALSISNDLGLSSRGYKKVLLPLVRELRNGDRPKVDA